MSFLSQTEFRSLFFAGMEANGFSVYCTDANADAFYTLTELLLETNAVMNLTAITEVREIIVKHYADCMKLLSVLPEPDASAKKPLRMADIGTGAGFPSLPIAILRPDLRILAIDSTQKKLDYVGRTAKALGLSNLSVLCGRAEELGQNKLYRESFDIVTARAVARMNVLSEWCLPLVSVGGIFAAMKGKNVREELSEAEHALSVLGGECVSCVEEVLTPIPSSAGTTSAGTAVEASSRGTILVRKTGNTPALYPRSNAQIQKKKL